MIAHTQKILVVFLALALSSLFGGCDKKPAVKGCKADADCRVDASGNPQNGVCHMGKCEECVENTDCTGMKQCINYRCESTCSVDADCGANKHCESGICMQDCTSNDACGGDRVCARGRCMSQAMLEQGGQCEGVARIHYDFDRYDIKASEREQADKLAACMEANQGTSLLIEGHTDVKGTPSYNAALGERRAISVKNYLQSKGIGSHRLNTVSYGEQRPLDNGNNEHAWQQNRRAEWNFQPAR